MQRKKTIPTTKTVDDLFRLLKEDMLLLNDDFQRNSVWPPKAKAYLIDAILVDRPIPLLFISRERDANSNTLKYRVIDGQQRLRAAFSFLQNEFRATESKDSHIKDRYFKDLSPELQEQFIGYSFILVEIQGYSELELRDVFTRINKYVVKLNPQEVRDAQNRGPFANFVDQISKNKIWSTFPIFTATHISRKRNKEFIAELAILCIEGPQDKKASVDLYYSATADQFSGSDLLKDKLLGLLSLAKSLIPQRAFPFYKRLPAIYALIGALVSMNEDETKMLTSSIVQISLILEKFADYTQGLKNDPGNLQLQNNPLLPLATRFLAAMGGQTDNVKPRLQGILVFRNLFFK